MNYKILGLNKTDKNFILNISKISNDISALKDNLSQLNIFSEINILKNRINCIELKNKISINTKGKDKNCLNINFPNILGKGETINVDFNSLKEYEISFKKPFIISKLLVFLNLRNKKGGKSCNEVEISNKKLSVGYGLDKYLFMKMNLPFLSFSIKQGILDNTITRLENKIEKCVSLCKNINYKIQVKSGMVVNNLKDDLFKISIMGYDKSAGKSYVEVNNRLIYKFKDINFYLYNSIGYAYKKSSLYKDVGMFIYERVLCGVCDKDVLEGKENILKNTNEDIYRKSGYGNILDLDTKGMLDSINKKGKLNMSVGTGINIPLSGSENSPSIDISMAFPLLNNPKAYAFSFGIDF